MLKFLIDECLSPDSVAVAVGAGFSESSHVTWLGKSGWKDWEFWSIKTVGYFRKGRNHRCPTCHSSDSGSPVRGFPFAGRRRLTLLLPAIQRRFSFSDQRPQANIE